jgi:ubiquinone/menaquinone biosynthesis C-methylase UbiE
MKLADHTTHYKRDAEQFDYFAERTGADHDAARRLQQTVIRALRKRNPRRVLDLGSGSGWLHEALAANADAPALLVSADLGIASLRTLRGKFPHALLVAADAERLPFRPAAFDTVVASEVLEHLNHPAAVLRQAAEVLSPAGTVVASTPYRERLKYYLCIHCNKPTPVNAHLHSFDEHALRALFESAELRAVRFTRFQNKGLVFLRISYALRALPWTVWRLIDQFCNFAYPKPLSIVMTGDKPDNRESNEH